MVDQVPLSGPFVTQEEAASLAAALEAQRAENAASEKEKKVLRKTRSTGALATSSSGKPKVSKKPTKEGFHLEENHPFQKEKVSDATEGDDPASLLAGHPRTKACL